MANNTSRTRRQPNLAVVPAEPGGPDPGQQLQVGDNQEVEQGLPEAESESRTALDDLLDKAEALPNIDNRSSVLGDAPVNLKHEGREEFEEEEEATGDGARWGRPNNQEFVRVDPDPAHSRVIVCVKAKRGGAVYPVSEAMLKKHPELPRQARRYLVRLAVTCEKEGGEAIMWPAPAVGPKDAPSDPSHRLAQRKCMKEWLRTEWDGNRFQTYRPKNPESYGEPKWPNKSFNDLLMETIEDIVIRDDTHEFLIQLLGL